MNGKQHKCPSTGDEQTATQQWKGMIYYTWSVYKMGYYSAMKNNEILMPFGNMNGPRDYHIKWSKSDREWQI